MSTELSLYEVIGVSPTATTQEIERACLTLGEQHHPDKQLNYTKDTLARTRFAEIEKAYDTLTDPEKRARYDAALRLRTDSPGILAYIGLFILFVLVPLHFIGFMFQWFNSGFDQAKRVAPVGYIVFFIIAIIAYAMAIPFLARRGYDGLAKAMFIVGLLVAFGFVLSIFGLLPAPQDCEVTRGGYTCR